jgi:hypothetical protein
VHPLVGPVENEVAEADLAAVTISAQIHRFAPVCGNYLPRGARDHQSEQLQAAENGKILERSRTSIFPHPLQDMGPEGS